jgi:hypothetical protein
MDAIKQLIWPAIQRKFGWGDPEGLWREPHDRVSRNIVVSIPKTGTHMVYKLMETIGYQVMGVTKPTVDRTDQYDMLQLLAWAANLGWDDMEHTLRRIPPFLGWRMNQLFQQDFGALPHNLCVTTHDFRLERLEPEFIVKWAETGHPRIFFNYRDPRDQLISFVNFLCGKAAGPDFNRVKIQVVWTEILRGLPTLEERLMVAICDPSFPWCNAFNESMWLLHHPAVCKIRYEDLVGSRGGGSDAAQVKTVARVLAHLDCNYDAEAIADQLYGGTATFAKGRTGSWRDVFTTAHLQAFNKRYGDILRVYGYEVVEKAD